MKIFIILLLFFTYLNANGEELRFIAQAPNKSKEVKKPPTEDVKRPDKKPFPLHWGQPPKIQTRDLKPLPFGYGMGSSTLAKWIFNNVKKDKENGIIPKPPKRPAPSPEIKAKIKSLKEKKSLIQEAHKKLSEDLRGTTKEQAAELIRAFRESNKERHEAAKQAHKDLLQSIREKRQTGDRRE